MPQKKIKICHVVDTLNTGGMENGVINISNGLNRDLFEPTVVCIKAAGSMANRLSADVNLINLSSPDGRHPFRFYKLAKLFKQEKFSIIHTHGWGACSFDGILAAKFSRIPFLINGEHGAFFMRTRQKLIQKIIYRLCNAHLSVSNDLKNNVTKKLGIPPENITTISNGVDCERFTGKYNTEAIQNALNLPTSSSRLIIGNIGSLKPQKNQTLLLNAVARVKQTHPEFDLVVLLIGTGPDQKMLEEKADELGISNIIHFLGLREDIPQLLSIIDLLVSTSQSEGMSNVTLEGFASEVPIITTGSAGMGEIIQEGKTGYILRDGTIDELFKRLLAICTTQHEQLQIMGKTARAFVLEQHSIDKMVKDYEKFYLDFWKSKYNQ